MKLDLLIFVLLVSLTMSLGRLAILRAQSSSSSSIWISCSLSIWSSLLKSSSYINFLFVLINISLFSIDFNLTGGVNESVLLNV